MDEELVTIRTYHLLWEAEVARMTLATEGIRAFVIDDQMAHVNFAYSLAMGGPRLQVPAKHAERALALLTSESHAQQNEALMEKDESSLCPQCGEKNTELLRKGRFAAFIFGLFTSIPMTALPGKRHCADCGHTWRSASLAYQS